ncbi:hypothetical protein LUZ60_016506 [Juncus effusus]|nr:hypothetical protein LUZ60_016506 [Juncus effusus]
MKPISLGSIENGGSLVTYFRFIMREGRLHEILDPQIEEEEHIAKVESVAVLAEMCVRSKGEERPTMKEVLEVLWSSKPRSACNWNRDQRLEQQLEQQQNLLEDNQMLQIEGNMSGDSSEYESMLSNFPR